MYRYLFVVFAVFTAAAGTLAGQGFERRASLTGAGNYGQGKCTLEVVVDGTAEVEIRGDRATLRNLAGQTPQWRRFECTSALPVNPVDFQFSGVDGRGSQQLLRDPRNGGVAVVRISDPRSGAEGYTFDLTWTGGQYGGGGQQISTDEAIRLCQENVRQEAARRYTTSNVTFRRTVIEDNRGRRDLVSGSFALRNYSNRQETHDFSCSMNLNNGRIQSAQIDQQPYQGGGYNGRGGYYGDQGTPVDTATSRACERAVTDRIRRDGYQRFSFNRMNLANADTVVGSVTADRGNVSDSFDFTCSMAGNSGQVRSVQVNRR